jgi:hypothetical protein
MQNNEQVKMFRAMLAKMFDPPPGATWEDVTWVEVQMTKGGLNAICCHSPRDGLDGSVELVNRLHLREVITA